MLKSLMAGTCSCNLLATMAFKDAKEVVCGRSPSGMVALSDWSPSRVIERWIGK